MLLFSIYVLGAAISLADASFFLGRSKGGRLGAPAGNYPEPLPKAQWFRQKLDHFAPADQRTWLQKYYVNDSFYDFNNPGPIFLMIGGEGPESPIWAVKGTWIDYAAKFKAYCIILEHRYYGDSHPTKDLSVKNLQYLSSQQALADLANFISSMNDKLKLNRRVKWVAFGGSYPGSLAAWLRLKYPHLIHAAVSTSGPLLAKTDFMEYFQVVTQALTEKTGSDACNELIKRGRLQIETIMRSNPKHIEDEFNVCKPFAKASPLDIHNFYANLANNFADLVQYNEDNRFTQGDTYKNLTINTVCDYLTKPNAGPAYKRLAGFNAMILAKNNQSCTDYLFESTVNDMLNTSYSASVGGRQWMYQTCTEFGFYQTSSGVSETFGDHFPVDFYVKMCQAVFGEKFGKSFIDAEVDASNQDYGALDIAVSRVVFVHGSVDPWHALGITKTIDNDAPAVFIQGTAHCANMYPARDTDLDTLKEARVEIESYLRTWLDL